MQAELDAAWRRLNEAQREAAEWDDGPILVLAGPGSGKTSVLTCRIARLLNRSSGQPFRILGLTFTNKAADEMRTRVMQLVPGEEARLFLGTFHSFCADVLRQHGSHIGIRPNFEIYSQNADLEALLSEAVDKVSVTSPVVSDLDKKTLPVIQRMKSLLISPADCKGAFKDAQMGERMAIVYPAYEAELQDRNVLDFTSLILRTHELFQRFPALARRYRAVYPYVCVDEFQDTNHGQYQFLRAMVGEGAPNLFLVADDDQIIYQWNGASHQRIQEFTSDYQPHLVQLPVNYRCPEEIVSLANKLIQYNFYRTEGKKPLVAFRGSGGDDTVRILGPYDDADAEADCVAEDIIERHNEHLDRVVGIGRSRKALERLERALRRRGVSAVIAQRKDEFESPPLVWIHSMLRLANDRQSQRYLVAVCGSFGQMTGITVDETDVVAQADATNHDYLRGWISLAGSQAQENDLQRLLAETARSIGEVRSFRTFCNTALAWWDSRSTQASGEATEEFALYTEERDVWCELDRDIRAAIGDDSPLEAFLQELQMRSKEASPGVGVLPLYTIHASKGKEFDHVYIIGMVEDELPSFQSKKKGNRSPELEEERRNCFVAITRTSRSLTMSYGKRYNGWAKEPSRFLFEMEVLERPRH